MANIDPAPSWANIRRLETTDRNMAGPGGILNDPTTSIAARLNLLRDNDTTLGNSVAAVNARQDATDTAIANIQGQVLNAPGTLSDLENGVALDPVAGFPDVPSVENALGPVNAINESIESLAARSKQLRDDANATAATLAAGTGAQLVGYHNPDPASVARTVSASLQQWVTFEDFGAVGDGVTDDTAAIQAAINAVGRAIHLLPGRTYLCGEVRPANGVHLFSHATAGYTTDIVQSRPRILMKTGARCLFDVYQCFGFSITNVVLDGRDRSAPLLTNGSDRLTLFNVRLLNGSFGLGGPKDPAETRYTNTPQLIKCSVMSCGIGISNTIDGFFTATEIANCRQAGIRMQAGANSNTFVGGRVEWTQEGANLVFSGSSNSLVSGWMFVGTLFDRGQLGNVQLNYCSRLVFSGCLIHRGNRSGSTNPTENCNVYVGNSRDISFNGLITSRGPDDNGTGNNTPDYGFNFGTGNGSITLVGGSFVTTAGTFLDNVRNISLNSDVKVVGVGGQPDRIISPSGAQIDIQGRRFRSSGGSNITPTSSATYTLDTRAKLSAFSNVLLDLEITSRNATTGSAISTRLSLLVARGSTISTVNIGSPGSTVGAAGSIVVGGTGAVLSCAVQNIADDGSAFDLVVTNSSSANQDVRATIS